MSSYAGPALMAAALAAVLAATTACGGASGTDVPGKVDVVASTDVWGSVAADIGGRWVAVTSVISDPAQDPHSFEASARVLLEVKEADLLVENGGGYDDFMQHMVESSGTHAPVLDAVAISGLRAPAGGDLNEHVWYDFPSVEKVADDIAARLTALAPRHAAYFAARVRAFDAAVGDLIQREHDVRAAFAGAGVAITEPVPLYLLEAMGLRNLTPPDFSRAVEEGGDVAARVLADTLALYSEHRVAALVYNAQTSSPITEQVKAAAAAAGIPVVPVTETLPAGTTYLSWMRQNVTHVAQALEGR